MRRFAVLTSALGAFLLNVSCGSATNATTESEPAVDELTGEQTPACTAAQPKNLVGFWDGACVASAVNSKLYERTTFQFQGGGVFMRERRIFFDNTCQLTAALETMTGKYQIGEPVALEPTPHHLTFTVSSLALRAVSVAGAAALNAQCACGFSDWRNDGIHATTGVSCFGYTTSSQDLVMDLVGYDAGILYFGKRPVNGAGLLNFAARPVELDRAVGFRKR